MTHAPTRRAAMFGAAAMALAAPHVARAATRVVALGHNNVPASQYGQGCQALADAAARHPDLAGAIRIEVHPNAELGDELAMLTDCRAGAIDMMAGISSVAGAFCPAIGSLDVPFVFRSRDRGHAAFDGATGEEYAALLQDAGIHLVAWLENGLRHFTSNRPVRGPADVVGLKLRVPQSEVALASFRSLGAIVEPLAFNLLHEALRVGQFEAQENPIASIEAIRLQEVQKYLCLTGHAYSSGILVASPDLVDDLTPRQRAALVECGRSATARSREVAGAAERDGVRRLAEAGMVVVADIDKAGFARASQPNLEAMAARFGVGRMERLVKAAG